MHTHLLSLIRNSAFPLNTHSQRRLLTVKQFYLHRSVLIFSALLILTACSTPSPTPIDPKSEWLDFSDARAGYSIKYPATYRIVPGGNSEVGFRGPDKRIAYKITYATYDEARKRGLWVTTEPIGTTYVSGGITSHRYVYDYWDFPRKEHRVAFVIERKEKMLALEIPIAPGNSEGTLDEGQQAVLASFILTNTQE